MTDHNAHKTVRGVERNPLRSLALTALGMTGADIERIVRQARQKARRSGRGLTLADVERELNRKRAQVPPDVRWRIAVHEAGHAVVRYKCGIGSAQAISIDAEAGGYTSFVVDQFTIVTEDHYEQLLAVLLAGRAAEEIVLGNASAGSGGSATSDLALATGVAIEMETMKGFGGHMPLLYREYRNEADALTFNTELARCVNDRLQQALALAHAVLAGTRRTFDALTQVLLDRGALEGVEIIAVIETAEQGP